MQAVTDNVTTSNMQTQTTETVISLEIVAYIVLFTLAILLRVAELDAVPVAPLEATHSMQTLQAIAPQTPGTAAAPDSPILFLLQGVAFSAMGATEFTARIGSVLGGMLLVMSPLLFRSLIGRERTLLVTLMLVASPVVFIATRQADAFIWTGVFAILLLWTCWRWWLHSGMSWAIGATICAAALIFLSHAAGALLAIILAIAAWGALWWTALNAPEERDEPGDVLFAQVRERLSLLPWQSMLGIAALIVLVTSTIFMMYPAGLGHVGNLLSAALEGLVRPATETMPFASGFISLWVYEFGFVILGIIASLLLIFQNRVGYMQRMLILWAVLAMLASLFYRGATPAFALWVIIPLSFLIADLVIAFFVDHPVTVYWTEGLIDTDVSGQRFSWVKYAIGLLVFAALIILAVHFQEIGRGLQRLPLGATLGDTIAYMREPIMNKFRYSLLLVFVISLLIVISMMLVASIWGNRAMFQAIGIGFFAFIIGSGIGGGWQAAVVHASNPAEFWYSTVTDNDAYLLRETLYEVSQRETAGEPLLDIVAVRGGALQEEGVAGWLLRDYPNTRYVGSYAEAARNSIVLLPDTDIQTLSLGGDYVGQRFVIQQPGLAYDISPVDWLGWVGQRRLRSNFAVDEGVYLWLRQDVYDAVPEEERQRLGIE